MKRNDLMLYAIVGGLAYVGFIAYKTFTKPRFAAGGGAPATNPGGTTGGAVPGSPNQVLTADQELATAISHGYTAGI